MFRRSRYAGFDHAWQDELHELYQLLIPAGAAEKLADVERVVIVAHHVLHYFPFAALVTDRDEKPRSRKEVIRPQFLIDGGFSISYSPSLATWAGLRQRKARPVSNVRAVGIVEFPSASSLPGVAIDLANFQRVFDGSVKGIYEGREVTESRVQTLLRDPGLVLVATHGQKVPHAPLNSYLLVHAEGSADKYLTAREIFETPVGADVVVMSACYSGLAGRSPLPGDDLFGLQRALLHSGARSVVCGLWDIHDNMGPVVLEQFMKQFSNGRPLADALADAQRAFLATERESYGYALHPYFWAVFVASGDDRTYFVK